jgi:hypothetical protein
MDKGGRGGVIVNVASMAGTTSFISIIEFM